MRQPEARSPRMRLAVAKPVVSAIQVGRVALQPAEAEAEEEPPGMDMQRLAFAAWPDHNWCKRRRCRRVAFHISDKTCFGPKLPACLKSTHRTGACYSTRNQRVNMQMPLAGRSIRMDKHRGSHEDAVFVLGLCTVVGYCPGDNRTPIRPTTIRPHNENTRKRLQKLHSPSAVA
jgi:hypothetical protein